MRQSGIAVPSGETFWPTRCTRPSRFVTLPAFSPHIVTGRNTSARFVLSVMNASIAIVKPAAFERALGQRVVREVVLRVGAEQHQRLDPALLRGAEDPGGVEPAARAAPSPTRG